MHELIKVGRRHITQKCMIQTNIQNTVQKRLNDKIYRCKYRTTIYLSALDLPIKQQALQMS